ncbi:MAG: endonuclease MutS2, partial [Methanobrevibacter sp.]|nr:endonuclease MutS2 [Methanobrevibacter sp.]
KLSQKIIDELGGEDELNQVIENLDLERLINIDGISQRKAIEIMNQLIGNPAQKFLKSDRAIQLYEEIIEKIVSYSNTSYAKNRILLLAPIKDEEIIEERLNFVMNAKEKVSELPLYELDKLMKHLHEPKQSKPNYDASKAILVESNEDADYLMDLGLNRYYTILTASDSPFFQEELRGYELIYYIYTEGFLDLGDMPNLIMINKDAPIYQLVPEVILDYFKENRDLFERVSKIKAILGEETVLNDIGPILDELESYKTKEVDLDEIVNNEKRYIDRELKERIQNIDLEGDEVLDLLNNALPPKLEEIFDEILSKSKETIKLESGIDFDPFIRKYPIEIDDMEMERVKTEILSNSENNYFDKKSTAAEQLASIKEEAEREVSEVIKFDYEYALGSFAYLYDLNKPEFTNEYDLHQALHLNLCLRERTIKEGIQRVDYRLNEEENIALLTGANSGGKTTLLETISQIAILGQMGLPVPAKSAKIKLLDEIYHFSKKRSLDAGAFESFLNVFMPIVTSDSEKLVLLDELEG